ncbi:MAG: TonB family protein [Spirochaetia bacterium]
MPGVRAMPFVISLALHAALVTLLGFAAFRAPAPVVSQRAVDILVVSPRGSPVPRGDGAPVQPGSGKARSPQLVRPRPTYDAAQGAESADQPDFGSPAAAAFPMPAAADVLSDAHPDRSGAAGSLAGNGLPEGTQFGWEGATRKLVRKRNPVVPAILSTAGQEVECQARITVSPSGGVTHVEIVSSSGYIEIDASVEAALRDYLFSRVDGRKDEVGTVRFHFRLERLD